MMKFLKFAFTISSFSTPIFVSMGEASMEASAKKKGRRGVYRDTSISFMLIIIDGNAIVLPNALGSTIAIPVFS
jgi:hypothetical protein